MDCLDLTRRAEILSVTKVQFSFFRDVFFFQPGILKQNKFRLTEREAFFISDSVSDRTDGRCILKLCPRLLGCSSPSGRIYGKRLGCVLRWRRPAERFRFSPSASREIQPAAVNAIDISSGVLPLLLCRLSVCEWDGSHQSQSWFHPAGTANHFWSKSVLSCPEV